MNNSYDCLTKWIFAIAFIQNRKYADNLMSVLSQMMKDVHAEGTLTNNRYS